MSSPTKPPKSSSSIMDRARVAVLKTTGLRPLEPGSRSYSFVSTGSFSIDQLIGGTKTLDGKGPICPGFPRRKITEVFGAESSGKTTLLISAMVEAQRAGGKAMFIDFEHSIDLSYAHRIGLSMDRDKMIVYQPETMEQGFALIYTGIALGIDIIGVDSVAAMVPKAELEKGFNDPAKIGAVAAKFSRDLPKIGGWLNKHPLLPDDKTKSDPKHPGSALVFLNQTRAVINTGYGGGNANQENTSGGMALKFYAYERLSLARVRAEAVERRDPMTGKKRRYNYGNVTSVKVVKSKIDAKQGHSTQIFIRYGTGIDDYFSVIETGVLYKLIRKDGSVYTLGGEKFKGRESFRKYLIENPEKFIALRSKLAELVLAGAVMAPDDDDEDLALVEAPDDFDDNADEVVEEVLAEEGSPESGDNAGTAAE